MMNSKPRVVCVKQCSWEDLAWENEFLEGQINCHCQPGLSSYTTCTVQCPSSYSVSFFLKNF